MTFVWHGSHSPLFLFLDARADPVSPVPWVPLILLLVIVFVLAVGFVAGLVALLIWFKRRQARGAAESQGDGENFIPAIQTNPRR